VLYEDLVRSNQARYFQSLSAEEKRSITLEIVDEIQQTGRFLRRGDRCWIETSRGEARQKVAHAIQYLQRKKSVRAPAQGTPPGPVQPLESGMKSKRKSKKEQPKLLYSRQQIQQAMQSAESHCWALGACETNEAFHAHSKMVHACSNAVPPSSFRSQINQRQTASAVARRRGIGKSDPNERDESDILSVSSFFLSNPAFVEASARNFIASCGKPPPLSSSCRFQEATKQSPEATLPEPSGLSSLDASGIYTLSDDEIRGLDGQESLASYFVNNETDPWNASGEYPKQDRSY
jgi:hypothetical protein